MREMIKIWARVSILVMATLAIIVYSATPRLLMGQVTEETTGTAAEEQTTSEASPAAATGSVQKMGPVTSCGYDRPADEADIESGAGDEVQEEISQEVTTREVTTQEVSVQEQVSPTCTEQRAQKDSDGDGVMNCEDNCPSNANLDQADADGDGFGDICEIEKQYMCNRGYVPEEQCQ